MSYFDHVRCSACKALLDPEQLVSVRGQGASCPRCKAPLSLQDLFGLADAFAEEDEPELSLDDLVSGARTSGPASAAAARPSPDASARDAHTTAVAQSSAVTPGQEAPSALDLMRRMRKKR